MEISIEFLYGILVILGLLVLIYLLLYLHGKLIEEKLRDNEERVCEEDILYEARVEDFVKSCIEKIDDKELDFLILDDYGYIDEEGNLVDAVYGYLDKYMGSRLDLVFKEYRGGYVYNDGEFDIRYNDYLYYIVRLDEEGNELVSGESLYSYGK